jgi:hypothetical protein
VLAPPKAQPAAAGPAGASEAAAAPPREAPDDRRLFEAACALAGLAQRDSQALLREGATIILRGLGAARGCFFMWNSRAARLDLAATAGEPPGVNVERLETERAAAERAARTGEPATLPGRTSGDTLLCVPVREGDEAFGVLCVSRKADGSAAGHADRSAAVSLAGSLARLYRASVQREQFASLALRDPETGLLKADAFSLYLAKLLGRAGTQNAAVALVLLAPERGRMPPAASLGRIGAAIAARLPKGWQGGRLSANRFAVVGTRRPGEELPAAESYLVRAAASGRLVDLGAPGPDMPRLRTSLAEFPKDAVDAKSLLAEAEERLGAG